MVDGARSATARACTLTCPRGTCRSRHASAPTTTRHGLFIASGPYTFVVLANLDPPAAERFLETTGRMLRRATGSASRKTARVRTGEN